MDVSLTSQYEMQKAAFAPILRLLYSSLKCDVAGFILPNHDYIYLLDYAGETHELARDTEDYQRFETIFQQISVMHGEPSVSDVQDASVLAQAVRFSAEQASGIVFVMTEQAYTWTVQDQQHIADAAQLLKNAFELQRTYTAEESLQSETTRYLQILDAIPDPIYVKDRESRLIWANKAFCEFFGKPLEDLIGLVSMEDASAQGSFESVQEDHLVFMTGRQHQTTEEAIMRSDGQKRDFLTAKSPLFDDNGEPYLLVGISTDITETKNVERYLLEALQEREQLIELKTNFVSMVSHEFRTPLAVIVSAIDILSIYFDRLSEEKRVEKLDIIYQQIQRLTYLMDDVLLINRGDVRGLPFMPKLTDVVTLSRNIIEDIESTYSEQAVSIVFTVADNPCPEQMVDENLFRHIVQNLLSNAVKYSHKGGEVRFSLSCLDNHLKMVIDDDGIGIPQANQATLFQSFRRADNVGTIQGTGLGLAIVKRAIETHGGTIEFESIENRGSIFTVTLHTQHDDLVQEDL